MKNQKREHAPPGAIPPIINKPLEYQLEHFCIFPAKPRVPIGPKTDPPPAKVKPEPTMEQRIADEVTRRVNNQVGNFFVGYIIGECVSSLFHKHHED